VFGVQEKGDESSRPFSFLSWAGLLTREIGAERAQLYLDAHEESPLQALAERAMDLADNRGGILGAQKLMKNNKAFDLKSLEQNAHR